MKNIILTFAALFVISIAFAHPPKSVSLNYNKAENILKIDIEHGVKDPTSHYIKDITIYVNSIKKESIPLTKQSSPEFENYSYSIKDLKVGDKVKVSSTCNKMGSKSKEIEIK